jgi:N-acyl-D-amino-acid deacylase
MKPILYSTILLFAVACSPEKFDSVIRNVRISSDGQSSSESQTVGIRADTIAVIQPSDEFRGKGEMEIDGTDLVLAPGFIDTHSHHDRGLKDKTLAIATVSQGITTIVVGQDGGSDLPLKKFFQLLTDTPAVTNVASYSGHNTLRDFVMGNDFKRHASQKEIDEMKILLKEDMEAGALGLSTGLEYDPGIYSSKDEVLQLASVLSQYNGRYISHLRSEDRYFWDALDEIITIGKQAHVPVQVSHFKLAQRNLWGKTDSTLNLLEDARRNGVNITADLYPYTYWSSTIRVLFPKRNFSDPHEAAYILKEVTSADGIVFSSYSPNPEFNGKTLAEVAKMEKKTPEQMLIELIKRLDDCDKKKGDCDGSIVATSMDDSDVKKLMQWAHTNICSDGSTAGRHPRGFGAFTRVLGHYVRDEKTLTQDEAIFKMTALSANHLGIAKRGSIKTGFYADLVLFDPKTARDESTINEPQKISEGIKQVWVNGVRVWLDGKLTGKVGGRVIKRK